MMLATHHVVRPPLRPNPLIRQSSVIVPPASLRSRLPFATRIDIGSISTASTGVAPTRDRGDREDPDPVPTSKSDWPGRTSFSI